MWLKKGRTSLSFSRTAFFIIRCTLLLRISIFPHHCYYYNPAKCAVETTLNTLQLNRDNFYFISDISTICWTKQLRFPINWRSVVLPALHIHAQTILHCLKPYNTMRGKSRIFQSNTISPIEDPSSHQVMCTLNNFQFIRRALFGNNSYSDVVFFCNISRICSFRYALFWWFRQLRLFVCLARWIY